MDNTEYDFVIADAVSKNIYVDCKDAFQSDGTKLGTIVTYSDAYSSQYTHLRSSLLACSCFNLFSMIDFLTLRLELPLIHFTLTKGTSTR